MHGTGTKHKVKPSHFCFISYSFKREKNKYRISPLFPHNPVSLPRRSRGRRLLTCHHLVILLCLLYRTMILEWTAGSKWTNVNQSNRVNVGISGSQPEPRNPHNHSWQVPLSPLGSLVHAGENCSLKLESISANYSVSFLLHTHNSCSGPHHFFGNRKSALHSLNRL